MCASSGSFPKREAHVLEVESACLFRGSDLLGPTLEGGCCWALAPEERLSGLYGPPSEATVKGSPRTNEGCLQLAERFRRRDRAAAGPSLAPRPFRHEHRRNRKRPARRSDGSRSQFQPPRLSRPPGNRARSRSHLQATFGIHISEARGESERQSERRCQGRNSSARTLRPFHRARH